MNKITTLISDDHSIVRAGLRILLEADGDIVVVGEATNGQQAVQEAKRLRPRVVLLDLAMPLLNGIEAARQIIRDVPSTRVLVLSAYSDDQHVWQAIQAGVTGYVLKHTAADDLLRAVRETAKGNAFVSPSICQRLLTRWRATQLNADQIRKEPAALLSRRQSEVLQLIAEGYMSKQIAPMLSISLKTVEKHRQSLMQRLELRNIAALTRYAIDSGIIESGLVPNMRFKAA